MIGTVLALLLWAGGSGSVLAHSSVRFSSQFSGQVSGQFSGQFQPPRKSPPVVQKLRPSHKKPVPQFFRHDNAQRALRDGEIVSLGVIRQTVRKSYPGRIVDVQLHRTGKPSLPYTYMVKVLMPDGQVMNVMLNAKTARIVGVRGGVGQGRKN